MKPVCFACGNAFHILVAFILSTTIYRDRRKILLVTRSDRTVAFIRAAETLKIWNEVIVMDRGPVPADGGRLPEVVARIGRLHFFTWGSFPLVELLDRCIAAGVEVILTDEGIGTYNPTRRFSEILNNRLSRAGAPASVSLAGFKEIWLLEPRLFGESTTLPLRKIDIQAFYDACKRHPDIRASFIQLFGLDHPLRLAADVVYFRQYFAESHIHALSAQVDALIDHRLCSYFRKANVWIKNHPVYSNENYSHAGTNLLGADMPWEALIIYSNLDNAGVVRLPKVHVSGTSSAMVSSAILGATGDFVFTYRILQRYSAVKLDTSMDDLIGGLRATYPLSTFAVPESWDELEGELTRIAAKYRIPIELQEGAKVSWDDDVLRSVYGSDYAAALEQSRRVQGLSVQVVEARRTGRELQQRLARKARRARVLRARLRHKERALHEIQGSRAWRLVTWLRQVRHRLISARSR